MTPYKDSDDEDDDDYDEHEQEARRRRKFVPSWARYVIDSRILCFNTDKHFDVKDKLKVFFAVVLE